MPRSIKRFNKINVEISNICNLQCSFCPEVQRSKVKMSRDLFSQIISQIAPLTEQVCLHLMGEPLTHPELADFIQICADHQLPVFFVSNAALLQEKHFQTLLNPIIRQLNFSLHSFSDNFPNKNPDAYLEKIFTLTELAFTQRPDLYINYRLWNLQRTDDFSKKQIPTASRENQDLTATKHEHNLAMLDKINSRFKTSTNEPLIDKLQSIGNIKNQKSLHITARLYLHFDTEFIWPSLDLPVLGHQGTCYGLKSHFGILADGTVVPCCLDKEGNIPLGHICDSTIDEILSSPRAQKMILGFKQNILHEELCKRCQYIERFS